MSFKLIKNSNKQFSQKINSQTKKRLKWQILRFSDFILKIVVSCLSDTCSEAISFTFRNLITIEISAVIKFETNLPILVRIKQ